MDYFYTFNPPIEQRVAWDNALLEFFYTNTTAVWVLVGLALAALLAACMLLPRTTVGLAFSTAAFVALGFAALYTPAHFYDNPIDAVTQEQFRALDETSNERAVIAGQWLRDAGVDADELCSDVFAKTVDGERKEQSANQTVLCGGTEPVFVTFGDAVIRAEADTKGLKGKIEAL